MHPIDRLFADMPLVEPYPDGVVEVPDRIPGVAFFPGGAGLWGAERDAPLPAMPTGGIMVLGHDFHSEAAFKASLKNRTEVPDKPKKGYRIPATWTGLRRLFTELGIPLERCFFTNAYMGLRKGKVTMGRFPGASDQGYVDRCRQFLLRQIDAQQPSVIITLGTWVPSFIAPLSKDLRAWRDVASLAEIDERGAVVPNVAFNVGSGITCTVVAITHPSLRGPNVGRRRYKDASGHRAELEMLHDALRGAGWALPALSEALPLSVRSAIIETYAQWTALSALRSNAPIRSRQDVYTALRAVDVAPLFALERGAIDAAEFDAWHEAAVEQLIAGEPRLSVGWSAKIVNVYLKTRAYVGHEGREGLGEAIHPPIDGGLWLGIERRFSHRPKVIAQTHCVTKIRDITTYDCYTTIIDGCRAVAGELGCSLIEVEQLWAGTELKEVIDEG